MASRQCYSHRRADAGRRFVAVLHVCNGRVWDSKLIFVVVELKAAIACNQATGLRFGNLRYSSTIVLRLFRTYSVARQGCQ